MTAAAITACRDSEKVQVNAVRALGHLFAVQCPHSSQHDAQPSSRSSQQPAVCSATANHDTPEEVVSSCGQVNCSCGSASHSQECDNGCSSWWGEEWLAQGTQCLVSGLGSSTEKVWFRNSTAVTVKCTPSSVWRTDWIAGGWSLRCSPGLEDTGDTAHISACCFCFLQV